MDHIDEILKSNQAISASNASDIVKKLFTCANLAACCEVFSGWTIPIRELQMARTNEYLQLALQNAGSHYDSLGRNMAVRLNKCDTARVVHFLKLIGLLRVDTQSCDQLSLCCSVGERDRHALHQIPYINTAQQSVLSTSQAQPPLKFGTKSYRPKHIVMIDKDPALNSVYEQFNREEDQLLAMNSDIYDGLDELAHQIKNEILRPRNLVVSFRLAPEAFPDTKRFLRCVGNVITKEADFMITIGAGNNLAEFIHRFQVMNEIFEGLSEMGMRPIRIKYCKGKTPKQQQMKLVFGLSQYASYETIYCRLIKEKLAR